MQFNLEADNQDIVSLAYDLTNTNSVTYPIKEVTRAANKTLRKVWSWIFDAYGGWQYDDANNTDFPAARTNLVSGQQDYSLPSTALTVRGVEFLSNGNTLYAPLIEVTEEELKDLFISEASFLATSGVPRYYRPIGSSVKLYPTPNYNSTAGLRMTFDRGIVAFASTSSTQAPGFASQFHEVVSVGIAYEYARRNKLDSFQFLQADMIEYERDIKAYYTARFQEKYPAKMTQFDETSQYL